MTLTNLSDLNIKPVWITDVKNFQKDEKTNSRNQLFILRPQKSHLDFFRNSKNQKQNKTTVYEMGRECTSLPVEKSCTKDNKYFERIDWNRASLTCLSHGSHMFTGGASVARTTEANH